MTNDSADLLTWEDFRVWCILVKGKLSRGAISKLCCHWALPAHIWKNRAGNVCSPPPKNDPQSQRYFNYDAIATAQLTLKRSEQYSIFFVNHKDSAPPNVEVVLDVAGCTTG